MATDSDLMTYCIPQAIRAYNFFFSSHLSKYLYENDTLSSCPPHFFASGWSDVYGW